MPAKKTKKKRGVRRVVGKVVKKSADKKAPVKRDKVAIVVRNLILFGILFILSVIIASISNNEFIDQLFWILAILTAFVAIAFLIVLLVFFFMRQIRK
jgi:hypothetical protein